MTRQEFIKMCGVFGISLPFQSTLLSCEQEQITSQPFAGKVLIIGAGAGGLSAGYFLAQQGIDFEILEASSVYGGRMRIDTDFADFPIPLGAEWLETGTSVFQEIVNDTSIPVNIETIPDAPDRKFVNYSWYHFFEEYIFPSVSGKIKYNQIVQSIDYSGSEISINTQNDQYISDKVIIATPLKILQDGDITFLPALPAEKQLAIDNSIIWEGVKAFFEFSTKFYEDEYVFSVTPQSDGEKIYYNAALGQPTSRHILGLFTVGKPARDYINLSDLELKDFILAELDSIYSNQASPNYIKHVCQNWNAEPFIRSGYMTDHANWRQVRTLGESVADKIYFAGGAYTDGEDWVSVHTAAQSARQAIQELSQ